MTDRRPRSPSSLLLALGLWSLSIGLLAQAIRANRDAFRTVLAREPDVRFLLLAYAFGQSAMVLTFVRWFLLARAQGLPIRLLDAIRLGFLGNAVDLVVPGQIGGDVLKATFLGRGPAGSTRAIASIVVDRAVGVLGLFLLVGCMGLVNWPTATGPIRGLIAACWTILACGMAAFAATLFAPGLVPIGRFGPRRGRPAAVLAELGEAGASYRGRVPVLLAAMVLASVSHGLYAMSFTMVGRALLATRPDLSQNLLIVPIVLFTTAVPLPFGALGLSEQVSDHLFLLAGRGQGAVIMMGFRLIGLAVGAVSVAVYLGGDKRFGPPPDTTGDGPEAPDDAMVAARGDVPAVLAESGPDDGAAVHSAASGRPW